MNQKKIYNILSLVVIAGMMAGFGYVWYQYIQLTTKTNSVSVKTIATSWPAIKILLSSLGVAIAISSATSLVALVVLLLSNRSGEVEVVYVKKNEESKYGLDKNSNEDIEETGQHNIHTIETILSEQGHGLKPTFEKVLTAVCREMEASQAAFFVTKQYEGRRVLELFATYAYHIAESKTFHYEFGEGLAGQVAKEGQLVTIKNIPEGYITILSGLGKASPAELIIAPIHYNERVVAVLEIASFKQLTRSDEAFIQVVTQAISRRITNQFTEEEVVSLISTASVALS